MNKIQESLEPLKADDALKQRTKTYLFQEMEKREKKHLKPLQTFRFAFALIACTFALTVGSVGYYLITTPVSYISVDINPSLELSLNRFDNVVDVSAYNEDGTALLAQLDLEGDSYDQAIDEIAYAAALSGYFEDTYSFEISVISEEEEKLIQGIENCSGYQKYSGSCHGLSSEELSEAHNSNLSFGKYNAYLELKEYMPEITPEDCQQMSMRQIRDLIEAAKNPGDETSDSQQGHRRKRGNHN